MKALCKQNATQLTTRYLFIDVLGRVQGQRGPGRDIGRPIVANEFISDLLVLIKYHSECVTFCQNKDVLRTFHICVLYFCFRAVTSQIICIFAATFISS